MTSANKLRGPLTSQSSLHLTSEFLEDLNSDLDIHKEPPPKDLVSPAFGQRYVPKLLRVLASEESPAEKKLKSLALFLTAISDDTRKAEILSCEDKLVFVDLINQDDKDIKTATCQAVRKLFEFTPTRQFLYKSGIVDVLLTNVDSVPGPVAECFACLAEIRDIVPLLLEEKSVVTVMCKLLTGGDAKTQEFAANTLGSLSRVDEGVKQVLAVGIEDLLKGLKQSESIEFKNACIYTIMQLCHSYDGKTSVIGASGVELLAECLQIQEEETQTLAMAALLGLSTELEAKERISDACVEDLMRLQYSPSPQLKLNTDNLIASISEFPAARAKMKKTVLVIRIRIRAERWPIGGHRGEQLEGGEDDSEGAAVVLPRAMDLSWAKEFIAGAVGGGAGTIVFHPLDTLKVRLQSSTSAVRPTGTQVFLDIVRREGVASLWKGVSGPLYTNALQNAVVFKVYSETLKALGSGQSEGQSPTMGTLMTSGMTAGAAQTVVTTPIEHLKIKAQMQKAKPGTPEYKSATKLAMEIVRSRQGIRGLFLGFNATLLRDVPSYGLYFLLYETTKTGTEDTLENTLLAGGLAGSCAWLSIYPVDVVKSRIQGAGMGTRGKTFLEWCEQIGRESGVRGFTSGMAACLTRAFFMNAVIFQAYEMTLKYMDIL